MKLIALNGVILPSSILIYPQTRAQQVDYQYFTKKIINNWDFKIFHERHNSFDQIQILLKFRTFNATVYAHASNPLLRAFAFTVLLRPHCISCARMAGLSPLWLYLYKWFYPREIDFICLSRTCALPFWTRALVERVKAHNFASSVLKLFFQRIKCYIVVFKLINNFFTTHDKGILYAWMISN